MIKQPCPRGTFIFVQGDNPSPSPPFARLHRILARESSLLQDLMQSQQGPYPIAAEYPCGKGFLGEFCGSFHRSQKIKLPFVYSPRQFLPCPEIPQHSSFVQLTKTVALRKQRDCLAAKLVDIHPSGQWESRRGYSMRHPWVSIREIPGCIWHGTSSLQGRS